MKTSIIAKQRGIALIVSLVLLLALTVIAITAATTSTLQEKMAYNSQQQNQAFQAAESGLSLWVNNFVKTTIASDFTNHSIAHAGGGRLASVRVTAPDPTNCATVVPSYSLNAASGAGTPQYACYEIISLAKSCADPVNATASNCSPSTADSQARSLHTQGYLSRTIQ